MDLEKLTGILNNTKYSTLYANDNEKHNCLIARYCFGHRYIDNPDNEMIYAHLIDGDNYYIARVRMNYKSKYFFMVFDECEALITQAQFAELYQLIEKLKSLHR